jgi:lipopolysaccharide heptosyltransferase I
MGAPCFAPLLDKPAVAPDFGTASNDSPPAGQRMSRLRFQTFRRMLIIKPSAVGDVVHALPILPKLRARFPDAQIDWLVRPEIADLVRCHPALSNVVLFDRRRFGRFGREWSATSGLLRLLFTVWRQRYDLVIDLHGQLRSAMFCFASASRTRLGFSRVREGARVAYTHLIPVPTMDVHAVDRYLEIEDVLGLDSKPPDFSIYLPPAAAPAAQALLDSSGIGREPFALLVPGTIWQTKHWRPEGFAEVGRYLASRGLRVVLGGTPQDRELSARIAGQCPGACDLAGRTNLAEFTALVGRAAICVTNDSGSMHLAAALNRPVVSAFGPTSPLRTGPYRRPEAVVRAGVECSPCYLRKLSSCRHDHQCMTLLTSDMLIDRIRHLLPLAA